MTTARSTLIVLAVVGLASCADQSTRVVGTWAHDVPTYLEPLAQCAQAHGYALPPVTWLARDASSLSNGAATCCIRGSEPAVVERWHVVVDTHAPMLDDVDTRAVKPGEPLEIAARSILVMQQVY